MQIAGLRWIGIAVAITAGAACSEQPVGSDRDAHGCIPSAGYQWCERTASCERPWELAERAGIESSAEAFQAFCSSETLE